MIFIIYFFNQPLSISIFCAFVPVTGSIKLKLYLWLTLNILFKQRLIDESCNPSKNKTINKLIYFDLFLPWKEKHYYRGQQWVIFQPICKIHQISFFLEGLSSISRILISHLIFFQDVHTNLLKLPQWITIY